MKTNEIRDQYLAFFSSKGHIVVPSDSLYPGDDPTLLFTGAGMNQFKDYFLGLKKDMIRATSVQKCLRTGDLDNVGKTPYHHSFFEMLGNFSFGDYFKEEAIHWAWQFLTGPMQIKKERLHVTVHHTDQEAYDIWTSKIGIPEARIRRLGDEDNFWPANAPTDGPNGPCGPCSEIFFEQNDGSLAEIWNLVFTQFNREDNGVLLPLSQKNIDTGAGLERFACVLQGKTSNFEIDSFQPIVDAAALGASLNLSNNDEKIVCRLIADHIRAAVLCVGDGVLPGNEGRGYVVRKLIRRAVWKSALKQSNKEPRSLIQVVSNSVFEMMSHAYPDLNKQKSAILSVLVGEESRFIQNLQNGRQMMDEIISKTLATNDRRIDPEKAFQLYDTFGYPDELIFQMARENGLDIDLPAFDQLREQQQTKAKNASKMQDAIFVSDESDEIILSCPETIFLGYNQFSCEAKVIKLLPVGQGHSVIFDQTVFYAEQGGQVGDQGSFSIKGKRFSISDTKQKNKRSLHLTEGDISAVKVGDLAQLNIDQNRRDQIKRHHSATHLLHAVLRNILGESVRQMGSLVQDDKLRFDFSCPQSLSQTELENIESEVNSLIFADLPVQVHEKSLDAAREEGAMAFFGDKYGDIVRVVKVGSNESIELCGGTHVSRTGEIGTFFITSQSSIGSGVRRIEAVTGNAGRKHANDLKNNLANIALLLKTSPLEIYDRVNNLLQKVKDLEKKVGSNAEGATDVSSIIQSKSLFHGSPLYIGALVGHDPGQLRVIGDRIRDQVKEACIIVLFSDRGESLSFVVVSTIKDQSAGNIAKKIGVLIEGRGGGKDDFAQGGGKRPELQKDAMQWLQEDSSARAEGV